MEGGLRTQVVELFNGERSEGIHFYTSMLEVSCTQHSLEEVQVRDVMSTECCALCTHSIPA